MTASSSQTVMHSFIRDSPHAKDVACSCSCPKATAWVLQPYVMILCLLCSFIYWCYFHCHCNASTICLLLLATLALVCCCLIELWHTASDNLGILYCVIGGNVKCCSNPVHFTTTKIINLILHMHVLCRGATFGTLDAILSDNHLFLYMIWCSSCNCSTCIMSLLSFLVRLSIIYVDDGDDDELIS